MGEDIPETVVHLQRENLRLAEHLFLTLRRTPDI